MCGIAVIVAGERPIAAGQIDRMVSSLAHRGPDQEGILVTRRCHLGHRRLCVIDPVGGNQPMWDDTQRWCISFNGEIYNFRELRQELAARGVQFLSQSDTEVLLLAYRQWGESVVDRLNGQFAFAIWDEQQQTLFAARDRLGEKPLYWAQSPQGELLIASELKAILAAGRLDPTLDPGSVDAYLTLMYVPPRRTIYANIQTLPPAHLLTYREGKLRTRSYWQPKLSTDPIDPQEAAEQTRTLLERAVARQMVADTRVGAFLSGGLDSTTIVALMSQQAGEPVHTFAAGFGDLINELPFARAVAERYHTRHHELQIDIPLRETLERMADVYDEPFGDSSNIPTYLLAQFASRHVKVVLSGDGGDELFGGYDWYRPLLSHADRSESVSRWLWLKAAYKTAGLLTQLGAPLRHWREQARQECVEISAKRRHPDLWQRHLAFCTVDPRSHRDRLWSTPPEERAERTLAHAYQPGPALQGMDRAVDFDLRCYLPGDILVKVDRAAMAHGLETRSPFMDVELVEFVMSVPWRLRFRDGTAKSLLRDACHDLWPETIRRRSKQGFGSPVANWLTRPELQSTVERVLRPGGPLADLLPGVVTRRRHFARRPQTCWNLLCLGLWLEKHATWATRRLAS